ncbi:MAG: DUF2934 domain-containing protein [Steroidobacteraceae bacterium]
MSAPVFDKQHDQQARGKLALPRKTFGARPNGVEEPKAALAPDATAYDPAQRHALIAEAAYYRAEERGFDPGHELEDWLDAELDIERSRGPTSAERESR